MNAITKKQLKSFANSLKINYSCGITYASDGNENVVTYTTNTDSFEIVDTIYYNEIEFKLSENHKEFLADFVFAEHKDEVDDAYDVLAEQGIFGYGY